MNPQQIKQLKAKQSKGRRTHIYIQFQQVRAIRPQAWKNIPKPFHKMSDGLKKNFGKAIYVKTEDIDTMDKLAFVTRKHVGYGTFNILGRSGYVKGKNYNPNFVCYLQRKKECKFSKKCRHKTLHKKGNSCMANRRVVWNWIPRAQITIMPSEMDRSGRDYSYKFDKRKNRMYYYWFWGD